MGLLDRILPPMSPDRFGRKLVKRLEAEHPDTLFEFDAEPFRVVTSSDCNGVINLHNIYAMYAQAGLGQRRESFERAVRMAGAFADRENMAKLAFPAVKERILPRVWSRMTFDLSTLAAEPMTGSDGKRFEPLTRPVGETGELVYGFVVDSEESVMLIGKSHAAELGKTFDELWPIARDNLYRQSVGRFFELGPGVWMSPFGDTHDATRMLLPDLFADLNLKGRPVVAVPRPEVLLVCGEDDARTVGLLVGAAREKAAEPGRTLVNGVFVLDADVWRPLRLPRDHPASAEVELNHKIDLARAAAEVSNTLLANAERSGKRMFIGELRLVVRDSDGWPFLLANWPEEFGVVFLPPCDLILFGDSGRGVKPEGLAGDPRFAIAEQTIGGVTFLRADGRDRAELAGLPTVDLTEMEARRAV